MTDDDVDRNLLFGSLALQACLIEAAQLAEACASWARGPERRLADRVVDEGWLTEDDRREVERLMERVIRRHGGDARAALGAVAGAEARDAIRGADDPAVRESLSSLPPAAGYVLVETLLPPGGPQAPGSARPSRPRYTLTRLHAEGGLGKVWLARDHDLNREVALKEIRPAQSRHPEMWRRFLKEAQVTGQLEHPNIVPVYELARRPEDDQPFYTMRFVRGRTLRRAIAEHHAARLEARADPLEQPRLLQAFLSVCQAIAYAHSRGVIHRDLKPENVVLGGFGEVIVLDWGLAKMVDQPDEPPGVAISEQARTDATHAGLQLGTPAYMAPEQAEGRVDLIDARTDIYGLGAILFEVLTGSPPHDKVDPAGLLDRIVSGETPRARSSEPSVPPALDAVCARAMARARDARYQKAEDLADDLQRWLADEPVSAFAEGWRPRLARWARHHRAWVRAGAAAGVMALVFSALYAYQQSLTAVRLRDYADELTKAQTKTAGALKVAELERDNAGREARRALQSLSDLNRERGLSLSESGDGRGLLWLAQAVENTPGDDDARQAANRTNLGSWGRSVHPMIAAFENPSVVAFSPDGKTLLTGGWDGVARLRKVADGEPVGKPMRHEFAVTAAAFSPDGKTVVIGSNSSSITGDRGNTARLWNAAEGATFGLPMTHDAGFISASFSPDGKAVATVSWDRTVGLWNAADGTPIGPKLKHPDVVTAIAFGPDSKALLTAGNDGVARLWNVADGTPVGKAVLHQEPTPGQSFRTAITAVAFSPDGKTFMTFGNSTEPRIWKTADGSPVVTVKNEKFSLIHDAAFSPDGSAVLTGGGDRTARLWRADNGLPIGDPMTHPAAITSVAFSPDGKTIVTGSEDKTARLWNAADGTPIGVPMYHPGRVYPVRFSPDGRTVLTYCLDRSVRLWDAAGGMDRTRALNPAGVVHALAVSPDGKTILAGGQGHKAGLRDLTNGDPVGRPFLHPKGINSAAFSPDGKTVLTGGSDKTARLWNAADGTPIGAPIDDKLMGNSVAFSPDGKTVLTLLEFGRPFRLWNAADGTPLSGTGPQDRPAVPAGSPGIRAFNAVFTPDGKRVLLGCFDRCARFLNVADGEPVGPPLTHQDEVHAVALSPDGRTAATGSNDGTARLWNAADGTPIGNAMVHQGAVNTLAFSPDGKTLLTGCADKTARFWNAADGSPLSRPLVHTAPITFVGFLPDGRRAVVSGFSVRVHDVPGAVEGEARRLTLWAQVATGMELLGDRNVIQSLDPKAWDDRRRRLLDAGGPPPGVSAPSELIWHRAQAGDARQADRWFAAHWHLDRLVADGAGDGSVYAERGRALIGLRRRDEAHADFDRALQLGADSAQLRNDRGSTHAMRGRWRTAADDFARAVELQPDDFVLRLRLALALLGADDIDGYRRTCADMLDRLGDRDDTEAILALTATCNVVPGSVPDPDRIVRLAEKVNITLFSESFVAALYRAGRMRECLAKLEEAAKQGVMKTGWDQLYVGNVMNRPPPPEYRESPRFVNATSGDLYYAAMALHRLGRGGEARQFLDSASKQVDACDKAAGDAVWPPWWSWVAAHRLRREAEELVLGKVP